MSKFRNVVKGHDSKFLTEMSRKQREVHEAVRIREEDIVII